MGIEDKVQDSIEVPESGNWIKRAYRKEWPTIGNHLLSCVIATGAATGFSAYAEGNIESDATISGIATAIDAVGYWGTLLPQLLWRDRKELRGEDGYFDRGKVLKKTGEYLSFVGAVEAIYVGIRFFGQYHLQKEGLDPASASATVQGVATVFFTAALPPLRYGISQFFGWLSRK